MEPYQCRRHVSKLFLRRPSSSTEERKKNIKTNGGKGWGRLPLNFRVFLFLFFLFILCIVRSTVREAESK